MKNPKPGRKIIDVPRFEESPLESDLLQAALADVRPLKTKKTAPRRNGPRHWERFCSEGEEKLLQEFVEGKAGFDWVFHPDYHQGGPQVNNSRLIRKLRRGDFSVQAQLDLHGLTQAEALPALEEFLGRCSRRGISCVRIIHGKGNNSAEHRGVLKRKVPQWLQMRRLSRLIVAFTSAPPTDGGIGATYVLLRKHPEGRRTKPQEPKPKNRVP